MLLLTEGQMSDHKGAALTLPTLPPARELIGDRGYDSNPFRAALLERGIAACIPSTRSRTVEIPYDKTLYRERHQIENTIGRWLWAAIAGSVLLQAAVIYVPLLQQAFSTVGLDAINWLVCTVAASSVLAVRMATGWPTLLQLQSAARAMRRRSIYWAAVTPPNPKPKGAAEGRLRKRHGLTQAPSG